MTFTYQAAHESRRDKIRCSGCHRFTLHWVTQGLVHDVDDPATSRTLCDRCATQHRPPERP